MNEIQLAKIKPIYGDLHGLLSQIPLADKETQVKVFTVNSMNSTLDELTEVTGSDYSKYKVPESELDKYFPDFYDSKIVRAQLGRVVNRLEIEYSLGRKSGSQSPSIVILNKNHNEVSLQINYTINDLINKTSNEEEKNQLHKLNEELEKPEKNWETLKAILIWILNFSKDLFLEVLPIVLQNKP